MQITGVQATSCGLGLQAMTQQKILIKWAGKDLECDIALDSTVGQLKRELQSLTQVCKLPELDADLRGV